MSTAIDAEGLTKTYPGPHPVPAVDGISLKVSAGEVFGLLGPNGAGKTTTVGICTTRIRPNAGSVRVAGIDAIADPSRCRRAIGVVSQFNTLDRNCTVWENLYYHCRYFAMGSAAAKARAGELLATFKLADRAKASTWTLSGGLAQRLQLARAMAHRPALLFLDEPTAGLDPQSRLALCDIIRDLRSTGVTILLTTHYIEEADELCDRVSIIDHGKVLVTDTPTQLKRNLNADTVIMLAVERDVEVLAATLRAQPEIDSAEPAAGRLQVMSRSGDGAVARVLETALPHGLRDVSVTEPTLESVFISLTGRDLRD